MNIGKTSIYSKPQQYVRNSGLRPVDFEEEETDKYWWIFPLSWFITLSIGALVVTL